MLVSILNSLFKFMEYTNIIPMTDITIVTMPTENIPEEITLFALSVSFAVNAFTKLFLMPLPNPKSKFKNRYQVENAIRKINDEMEDAQKEFSKLFQNNEKDYN